MDEGGPERDMTQRERRAMRAKKSGGAKASVAGTKYVKTALIVLAIAAPVAGIVWLSIQTQAGDCPGHWHAGMSIVILGQTVDYTGYNLESDITPLRAHFHRGNEGVWHMEPPRVACHDFKTYLPFIKTAISEDSITLEGEHGTVPAGVYENDGNNTVTAYVRPPGGEWTETTVGSILNRQLLDQERILFVYGNYTAEQIKAYQDAVPVPPGIGQG